MIRPTGKHIIIRRDVMTVSPDVVLPKGSVITATQSEVKVGSILVPHSARAKAIWGTVVAIGPKAKREGREFKVGDRVLIPWTWKPPQKDADLGEVELLEETEIMAVQR